MPFNPAKDIPTQTGKVTFITGGTSGIGKCTVLALAAHNPKQIYFTGRNAEAGARVVAEAKQLAPECDVIFIRCDLSWTRAAIRSAIAEKLESDRLDTYIANAGIMGVAPALTDEGFEIQFGTNVLGHAIILHLLRPLMLRTAALSPKEDVRFISLSSAGHTMHPPGGIEFDALRKPDQGSTWARYGQSKLGDILLAKGMAAHHPSITSLAVHPGLVATELAAGAAPGILSRLFTFVKWLRVPMVYKTPDQGAENTLWAVSVKREEVEKGAYYVPVGKRTSWGQAKEVEYEGLRERFWEWVEGELEGLEEL